MHIAVIDDGINYECYRTGNLIYDIEVSTELMITERKPYDPHMHSHGTTCAAIIKKYFPEAKFSSIKILEINSGKCIQKQLISAIEWCIDQGIYLINISLGSTDYRDYEEIRKCINKAAGAGITIVAAGSNKNIVTYPASLSNVIGVKCDNTNQTKGESIAYFLLPLHGIDFMVSGKHRLVDENGNDELTQPSNSFAAPYVTALAAKILKEESGLNIDEVKYKICQMSNKKDELNSAFVFYRKIDWVEKAVVLCMGEGRLNKTRYENYSFHVEAMINITSCDFKEGIQNIVEWAMIGAALSDADTVIIDAEETNSIYDMQNILDLWKVLIQKNKNLIFTFGLKCYNMEETLLSVPPGKKLWQPNLYSNSCRYQSDIAVTVPVIGVFNYCNNEPVGILSHLCRMFRNDGYHAVFASDSDEDVLEGGEYILLDEQENIYHYTKALYSAYLPDLIVLGLNHRKHSGFQMNKDLSDFPLDVRIYIIDNKSDLTDDDFDSESVNILLIHGTEIDLSTGMKVIDLSKGFFLKELYSYLVNELKSE
jgi:hypothetical protein